LLRKFDNTSRFLNIPNLDFQTGTSQDVLSNGMPLDVASLSDVTTQSEYGFEVIHFRFLESESSR
jgi:hypothetical protein